MIGCASAHAESDDAKTACAEAHPTKRRTANHGGTMPTQSSNPQKHSTNKKKASARQNATARMEEQSGTASNQRVPTSQRQLSHERFPGETPLTGEDRPARRHGAKVQGQSIGGIDTASGTGSARNRPPRGKHANPETPGRPRARKGNASEKNNR